MAGGQVARGGGSTAWHTGGQAGERTCRQLGRQVMSCTAGRVQPKEGDTPDRENYYQVC